MAFCLVRLLIELPVRWPGSDPGRVIKTHCGYRDVSSLAESRAGSESLLLSGEAGGRLPALHFAGLLCPGPDGPPEPCRGLALPHASRDVWGTPTEELIIFLVALAERVSLLGGGAQACRRTFYHSAVISCSVHLWPKRSASATR